MLDFFRRHQRYFFLVITVVIIISFSFFGTYSTLGSNTWREQIAFQDVNGREVPRVDVDEMALFLATDNDDKMLYGGMWGPNFLNDGVIKKDFLETGLAEELALAYREELEGDFDKRLAKEKKYALYVHPQAPFLSVENVWGYFSPGMNAHFDALRTSSTGLDPAAFNSRVQLYLAEKKLPSPTLKYILRYQEKQYPWVTPDDKLNQTDLSLFGYHTLEDWFGPRFTRLLSEFIINAALLAEAQGYEVSKAEAMADIVRNTQLSYQQNLNNPNLGVTSPEQYLNEQLRRLNMDQARAVKIWRQILLFRRYFHDAASIALIDDLASRKLHEFAHQEVTVDLYRLPAPLKLANFDELQQFEAYLRAVAKRNKTDPLSLPQEFFSFAEVTKTYPELVQKKYDLEVAQVSQKTLQARIGLRELWNWEAEEHNWKALAKQFPSLGAAAAESREARFKALDDLDGTTRSIVDAFAKQAIINAHPEWIDQALSETNREKMAVGLRAQGGKMPFSGLDKPEKRQAFIQLLDEAVLGEHPSPQSPLNRFSADDQAYYRITVLDRAASPEILTFAEARTDGTADEVRQRVLEKHYAAIRKGNPSLYQNEKGEWKPFKTVQGLVAENFLEGVLTALKSTPPALPTDANAQPLSQDQLAALRLYAYLNKMKEEIRKNPEQADRWVRVVAATEEGLPSLPASRPTLGDQWKIEKTTATYSRQHHEGPVDSGEAFDLSPNAWSPMATPSNGDLTFYQIKKQGIGELHTTEIAQQVRQAQSLLGAEAQRQGLRKMVKKLKDKKALSLAYLNTPSDVPSEEPESME